MSMSPSFLNFAYGSNLSSRRLRARTPSATPLGSASLTGHRLAWHKVGRDGSAKCDIVETGAATDCVWGVVYRIDRAERHLLDQVEGLGQGYDYKEVEVMLGSQIVQTGAYVATHVDTRLLPFDWYLALVLDGAEEHDLPPAYCQALQLVRAKPDPDPARCDINRAHLRPRQAAVRLK
ncbi:MAG: gamma-glutamylcyclotransferase family protein [Ideonella sp.]